MNRQRCWWCGEDALYCAYHDSEWGFPVADDTRLFEKLVLEGFQSGLSWITILRKRENFRRAFAGFAIDRVAAFGEADVARLLADPGIVRHRRKIEAAINNARAVRRLIDRHGSLAHFVWRFEPDKATRPARITRETLAAPDGTPESRALSKALKAEGLVFVGPVTCHAFMQAMGLVNDHVEDCATRPRAEAARAAFVRP